MSPKTLDGEEEPVSQPHHDDSWDLSTFDETMLKPRDPRPELLPGLRIGPYAIERELGRGGMGTVYLATRADETFEKKVAIKVTRGTLASPDALERFRRERQILARLEHPNIARLLDGGATADGLPYLVMEYIDGQPLHAHCDDKKLPTAARLRLFLEVCSAVEYAHHNLIVHRDLKPGNILVTNDGVPRLLDFCIAKLIDPEAAPEAMAATDLALTPWYASPEQIKGEPISTATDVYSLGVVLYELLTGHGPYRLATLTPLEVMKAVVEQEAEPPSAAIGVNFYRRGDLVRAEALLREGLAIQRKALGEDHPEVAFSMQSVGVILDERKKYDEAEKIYREALAIQRKVLGAEHPDIVTTLTNLANALSHAGKLADAARVYREALSMSEKTYGRQTTDTAHVLLGLAELELRQGRLAEAEALARESLATREKLLGATHQDVAESLGLLGRVLLDLGRDGEAESTLLRAQGLLARPEVLESRRIDVRDALRRLYEKLGRPEDAARYRAA